MSNRNIDAGMAIIVAGVQAITTGATYTNTVKTVRTSFSDPNILQEFDVDVIRVSGTHKGRDTNAQVFDSRVTVWIVGYAKSPNIGSFINDLLAYAKSIGITHINDAGNKWRMDVTGNGQKGIKDNLMNIVPGGELMWGVVEFDLDFLFQQAGS